MFQAVAHLITTYGREQHQSPREIDAHKTRQEQNNDIVSRIPSPRQPYQSLDLGGLASCLLLTLLGELTTDDELTHIIIAAQIEKLPDLAGTLRSQSAGNSVIGQSLQLVLTLNKFKIILAVDTKFYGGLRDSR